MILKLRYGSGSRQKRYGSGGSRFATLGPTAHGILKRWMLSSLWCGEGTGGSLLGRVHVDNACVVVTGGQQANTSSSYSIWSQVPRRDPSLAAPGLNHIASPCSSVADPRQVDADLYPIPVPISLNAMWNRICEKNS